MTNRELRRWLKKNQACPTLLRWVGKRDLRQMWQECEQPEWLIWLAFKREMGSSKELIHALCDCVDMALQYVSQDKSRPRAAIEATRKYAEEPNAENKRILEMATDTAAYAAGAAEAVAGAAWTAQGIMTPEATIRAVRTIWAAREVTEAVIGLKVPAQVCKKMCEMIRKRIKL